MLDLNITELIENDSQSTILKFSEADRKKAWLQSQAPHKYSNDVARWNAFLNLISQDVLSQWFKEEVDLAEPLADNPPELWEFVNGTSFSIGDRRVVIIPSETIDRREFSVPQEWVDIPKFVADYYLAVLILPDELSLCIWGATTHLDLKNQGEYDSFDGSYTLLRDELIQNIDALLLSLEVCPQQRTSIQPLPPISVREADKAIEELSKPCPYLPRLEVDFLQWGALLENDEWRQKLAKRRNQPAVGWLEKLDQSVIHLSKWLDGQIDRDWLAPQELFLTPAFRSDRSLQKSDLQSTKQIKELITRLNNSADEGERQIVVERLGSIGDRSTEVIDCLVNLIHTSKDKETRWTAVESLWTIAPETIDIKNSRIAGIKQATDLGMQLAGHSLALVVAFVEKSDRVFAIFVQVRPMESQKYLPPGCQMSVYDEKGNVFDEVTARQADRAIQKKFSGVRGDRFSIKVTIGDSCIGKDFLI
jgi:Protein of unknown function (DUF1822)